MKEETKTPQQILQEAVKLTNKHLVNFLNDANVRTRSDNARYILVNSDLTSAMQKFADKIKFSILQSFIEAEINRLEGMKKKQRTLVTILGDLPEGIPLDDGEKSYNQSIDDQIFHLKELLTN